MIAILIPTLAAARGADTGKRALLAAGCDARLLVVDGPRRGFTATVNDGLAQVQAGEDVCILNDDVALFTYGWLALLSLALHSASNIAMTCPTGHSHTSPMARGKLGDSGLEDVQHVPFWCVLLRAAALAQLGPLDARFIHYASDSNYCDRALLAGWRNVWVRDVWLQHAGHGSGLITEWAEHDRQVYAKGRGK